MNSQLGFLQFQVQFGNAEANRSRIGELFASATFQAGVPALVVLPELCFTGYDFIDRAEVASLAEPFDGGPTRQFLAELAAQYSCSIVAGYAEAAGDKLYNSAMLVLPDGTAHNYRKIHLFSRENDLFDAGDAPPAVYETPAGRVGMMICFDWFFPETARLIALAGAQIIAHPSNLVLPYCQRAMYCRSVENHVFSITANRIGTEDRAGRSLTFTGGSQVLNAVGNAIISTGAESEGLMLCTADVSEADAKQINPYDNLITSRRTDLYGGLL